VAFICSPPYLELRDRSDPAVTLLAAPVLSGERFGGRPVYFSEIIVPAGCDATSFLDLRGKRFAVNEPGSWSGYWTVRHHLSAAGWTDGFFGSIVETGYHRRSLQMVAAGEVDGAAIDCQVFDVACRDRLPDAHRVRVIGSLGPAPIQPVVASAAIDPGLRDAVRQALLSLDSDADGRRALRLGLVERFVSVDDRDYDEVRQRMAMARSIRFQPAQALAGAANSAASG
jgi:phosphonate transport system substrate-binding protein